MFRQIKSAIIWAYIYKFRKSLAKVLIVLFFIGVMLFLYEDVVEYLKITNRLDLLPFVIAMKWILIFGAIVYGVYLFLWTKEAPKESKESQKSSPPPKKPTKKEISRLAEEIIKKKSLR
ncbi:MAG: hypothetical protein C6H99_05335 [Epsilonproteobacteria bacterium]|nr:hypothetical protein [Campylobacterota bacterium]NPA64181.1 hypothetical protein [Campylobacterota bacterium]